MKATPPRLALRFLRWFCREDLSYHIEGDLLEFFQVNAKEKGIRHARLLYWLEVFKLLRPELIRFFHREQKLKLTNMTTHYFKLAIRRLFRNGKASFTSIAGVSIGLVAIFLMSYYIRYETSYDSFHEKSERIYMVERTLVNSKVTEIYDKNPYPLAGELVRAFPEIDRAINTARTENYFGYNDQQYFEENGMYAGQDFFDIFSFPIVNGSKTDLLHGPYKMVISQSLSNKIDPYGSVVGKVITLDKKHDFLVTGIFADYPENSHLNIDYLLSFDSYEIMKHHDPKRSWNHTVAVTYALLNPSATRSDTDFKIRDFLNGFSKPDQGYSEYLSLRPVEDVYLYTSKVRGGNGKRSEITIIYLFLGVVIFTVIVTALNYINSTVAQTLSREQEMGIKKVMGSSGRHLALQFFAEAATLLLTSLILSITISILLLPVFGELTERNLEFQWQSDWLFVTKISISALLIGSLSGIYPVFYLSGLKLSSFLHGITSFQRKSRLRKALVIFQLVVSIPLIFTAILVSEQISYIKTRDIGFERENLLRSAINSGTISEEKLQAIKSRLMQIPEVESCSFSSTAPFYSANGMDVTAEGEESSEKFRLRTHQADYDFIRTYRMRLTEGRQFSRQIATDREKAIIINESARDLFGWQSAVGKSLNNGEYKVIGVVKDFNDYTLFKKIRPMAIIFREEDPQGIYASIRVKNETYETAKAINGIFNEEFPEEPVQFSYLTTNFDRGYLRSLQNVGDLFIFFSILAVLLCAIGLYNLVSYSARMQQKMIAIRKVLGASSSNLSFLMLKEYLVMFLVAAFIGLSSSYYIGKLAFNVLPYHTVIKPLYLVTAGLIVLGVVMISVFLKVFRTVRINPVDAISNE